MGLRDDSVATFAERLFDRIGPRLGEPQCFGIRGKLAW
jgi:hypothetical protein